MFFIVIMIMYLYLNIIISVWQKFQRWNAMVDENFPREGSTILQNGWLFSEMTDSSPSSALIKWVLHIFYFSIIIMHYIIHGHLPFFFLFFSPLYMSFFPLLYTGNIKSTSSSYLNLSVSCHKLSNLLFIFYFHHYYWYLVWCWVYRPFIIFLLLLLLLLLFYLIFID